MYEILINFKSNQIKQIYMGNNQWKIYNVRREWRVFLALTGGRRLGRRRRGRCWHVAAETVAGCDLFAWRRIVGSQFGIECVQLSQRDTAVRSGSLASVAGNQLEVATAAGGQVSTRI